MANQWMDYLTSQRLQPIMRDDGDILFKHEGMTILLGHTPFRMCVPDIWPIENEQEKIAVLQAINSINGSVKFVKLFTKANDNSMEYIEAEIESVIDHSSADLETVFPNYLTALSFAVKDFRHRMVDFTLK